MAKTSSIKWYGQRQPLAIHQGAIIIVGTNLGVIGLLKICLQVKTYKLKHLLTMANNNLSQRCLSNGSLTCMDHARK